MVGVGCVFPLPPPPRRDPDWGTDPDSPPPWVALENLDAAPLNPILIQPVPRNPAAMRKKPANGRGLDPVAPQQRTRGIAKPAEVIYPRGGTLR